MARNILLAGLALAALGMAAPETATAQAARFDGALAAPAGGKLVTDVQYRRHGGYYGHRYYGRRHYDSGAAIGAGIAGLAAGAIIGGAIANAQEPDYYYGAPAPAMGDAVSYCMQRFRSYDPASGTYLGYDGRRRPCP